MIRKSIVIASLLVVFAASPASAHAQLEGTSPVDQQHLSKSPTELRLNFSEPVQLPMESIRVFDGSAKEVATDEPVRKHSGREVGVGLPKPLPDGAYLVSWRVVSQDTHPVNGGFTFSVGTTSQSIDADVLNKTAFPDNEFRPQFGSLARTSWFIFTIILFGLIAAPLLSKKSSARVSLKFLIVTIGIGLLGAFARLQSELSQATGRSIFYIHKFAEINRLLDSRFGIAMAAAAVALLAFLIHLLTKRSRIALSIAALAAAGSIVFAGHATVSSAPLFTGLSDFIHVVAMSIWLGSLLITFFVEKETEPSILNRYSRLAFWCVITLIATGVIASIRLVETPQALIETTYGQLLIAKLVFFVIAVTLAFRARLRLRNKDVGSNIRKLVSLEALALLAALTATATLIGNVPARDALSKPVSKTIDAGAYSISLTVDPAKAGPVLVHIYVLDEHGLPKRAQNVEMTWRQPSEDIGAIPVALKRAGPNHFQSNGFRVPFRGIWKINTTTTFTETNASIVSTTIRIK